MCREKSKYVLTSSPLLGVGGFLTVFCFVLSGKGWVKDGMFGESYQTMLLLIFYFVYISVLSACSFLVSHAASK